MCTCVRVYLYMYVCTCTCMHVCLCISYIQMCIVGSCVNLTYTLADQSCGLDCGVGECVVVEGVNTCVCPSGSQFDGMSCASELFIQCAITYNIVEPVSNTMHLLHMKTTCT